MGIIELLTKLSESLEDIRWPLDRFTFELPYEQYRSATRELNEWANNDGTIYPFLDIDTNDQISVRFRAYNFTIKQEKP